MTRSFFAALGAAACGAALVGVPASALDAGTWERDSQLIENGFVRALDENFQRSREREDWEDYQDQFQVGLNNYEGLVSPETLGLMREIAEQLRLNFDTLPGNERWQDASYFIRSKVVFATFVLRSYTGNLPPSTWDLDSGLIERGLLRTLDIAFEEGRGRPDWDEYHSELLAGLERFDGLVSPASLQLMREVAEQLRQNMDSIDGRERWDDASYFVRSQIVFSSFLLRAGAR